jgi:hypothetical protein
MKLRHAVLALVTIFDQSPHRFKTIPAKRPLSFFLHEKRSGVPPDSE